MNSADATVLPYPISKAPKARFTMYVAMSSEWWSGPPSVITQIRSK